MLICFTISSVTSLEESSLTSAMLFYRSDRAENIKDREGQENQELFTLSLLVLSSDIFRILSPICLPLNLA